MLKIGKSKNLILYKKESLFTLSFWLSLAIVFFVHGLIFVCFKVKPFKIIEPERKFSSAYIEMNATLNAEGTHTTISKEGLQNRISPLLELSAPTFYTQLPISTLSSSSEILNADLTALPKSNEPELKIHPLGPLTERIVSFCANTEIVNFNKGNPFSFCCEVQVDNRLGQIFDYSIVEERGIISEREIIHKIMNSIKFDISNSELISVGLVEVFVTGHRK